MGLDVGFMCGFNLHSSADTIMLGFCMSFHLVILVLQAGRCDLSFSFSLTGSTLSVAYGSSGSTVSTG